MIFEFFDLLYLFALLLAAIEVTKLIILFFRREKVVQLSDSNVAANTVQPFISIVIPARNEEKRIGKSLKGIASQTYPQHLYEVIVVNDHSTDNTASIVESFSNQITNLHLLSSPALPEGWGGKSFANHLGSQKAKGDFILFMDADVEVKPLMLERLMLHFQKTNLDVISIVPQRILVSAVEKIILAPVFLMIAVCYGDKKVMLNGEFIFFRRKVYNAIGGHSAIKSTVSDDLDFSALLEKTDYTTAFLYAEDLAASRMYSNFNEIYEGISKMLQRLLSENVVLATWRSAKFFLIAALVFMSLLQFYFDYQPSLFHKNDLLILPALIFSVCMGMSFYLRFFFAYGILMPIGWLFQPVMLFRSIIGTRKKVHQWKGRKVVHNSIHLR